MTSQHCWNLALLFQGQCSRDIKRTLQFNGSHLALKSLFFEGTMVLSILKEFIREQRTVEQLGTLSLSLSFTQQQSIIEKKKRRHDCGAKANKTTVSNISLDLLSLSTRGAQ